MRDPLLAELARLMLLPRALGQPGRDASIAELHAQLEALGLLATTLPFTAEDAQTGTVYPLANVVAVFRPDAPRRFVLATHFDTRPWADQDPDPRAHRQPVPGANDGTSGLAVILGLARALPDRLPPDVGFTVFLFDGEELGHPGEGATAYCAGSRHVAAMPDELPPAALRNAEFGIVLDMVGDAELTIRPEPQSIAANPELVERLYTVAAATGAEAFSDATPTVGITDDHVFLSKLGVPSILIIDYDYPPWHTRADTLDQVSGASLRETFDVVLATLEATYPSASTRP